MKFFKILFLLIFFISYSFPILCFAKNNLAKTYTLEEIEKTLLGEDDIPDKAENSNDPVNFDNLDDFDDEIENRFFDDNLYQNTGDFLYKDIALITILNKITTKSELVKFNIGEVKFFGSISIELHRCVKNKDPIKPANFVLITVFDNKLNSLLFHGWIESSNLSLSTLEHAIYEVIPVDCID